MTTVCLAANCLTYPTGGGHLWAYLNWALGFRSLGCDVVWLEGVRDLPTPETLRRLTGTLAGYLDDVGLSVSPTVFDRDQGKGIAGFDLEEAYGDSLVNLDYDIPGSVVGRFKRSAFLDIDPGLTQTWIADGTLPIAQHDVYLTIGETVGTETARFPDAGLPWVHTPPAVSLEHWSPAPAAPNAAFTTVTQWYAGEWVGGIDGYPNDKRDGFLPFLTLPQLVEMPLELAANIGTIERFWAEVTEAGWRVLDADDVVSTPTRYRRYIASSLGEFSCVKPSCVRMQNAWVSDRSLCYLASGKPVVTQHTGPSRLLPDDHGILRFRTLEEAVTCLTRAAEEYDEHSAAARALAEECFDARSVCAALLERVL